MSVNDMIKKSVLNSFSQYNVTQNGAWPCWWRCWWHRHLLRIPAVLHGVVYSRSFAVTLVGMCVLTCMVTLAISTNIVISLGMVGALSIVRYRTAVKDPMDLLYLFWPSRPASRPARACICWWWSPAR